MAQVSTYDPGSVTSILGGVPLTGYADGSMITIERNSETFMQEVGAQGDVTQIRSRDKTGKMTVRLLQSSVSNDFLTRLYQQDELNGSGSGALLVTDLSGRSVARGIGVRVSKIPPLSFAKEGEVREWEFIIAILELDIRGN